MKKFIFFLVFVGLLSGGIYFWKQKKKNGEKKGPEITKIQVERGKISLVVDTTGRVVSNLDVEIKCKASGQIEKLPYEVSEFVKKDKLLVQLDPTDEERRVNQSEVALSASQAKLAQAKQNLLIAQEKLALSRKKLEADLKSAEARAKDASAKAQRLKELLDKKLTSQEEFDTAHSAEIQAQSDLQNARIVGEELKLEKMSLRLKEEDVKLAEAQVQSDEIDLALARQRLKDTKVFSPIDGVVSVRSVQIGQIISSGISNVGGGTTMLTLSDLSRMFILASVDESDIGKIRVGQRALVTTDAYAGERFFGKVVRIATQGANSSNVITFEVKIEVFGKKKTFLKPEMTANVKIIAVQRTKALLVPSEAVYRWSRVEEKEEKKAEQGKKIARMETQTGSKEGDPKKNLSEKGEKPGAKPEKLEGKQGSGSAQNPSEEKLLASLGLGEGTGGASGKKTEKKGRKKGKGRSESSLGTDPTAIYSPPVQKRYIQVVGKDGQLEEREIMVGINDGLKVEVLKGLKDGDVIAIIKQDADSRWRNNRFRMRGRMMFGGGRRRK